MAKTYPHLSPLVILFKQVLWLLVYLWKLYSNLRSSAKPWSQLLWISNHYLTQANIIFIGMHCKSSTITARWWWSIEQWYFLSDFCCGRLPVMMNKSLVVELLLDSIEWFCWICIIWVVLSKFIGIIPVRIHPLRFADQHGRWNAGFMVVNYFWRK